MWSILNALDFNILNNMAQLFFFCTKLETKTVKNQDRAHHSDSFIQGPIHPEPYPSPHNQRH